MIFSLLGVVRQDQREPEVFLHGRGPAVKKRAKGATAAGPGRRTSVRGSVETGIQPRAA
jgi:hypothetical protein